MAQNVVGGARRASRRELFRLTEGHRPLLCVVAVLVAVAAAAPTAFAAAMAWAVTRAARQDPEAWRAGAVAAAAFAVAQLTEPCIEALASRLGYGVELRFRERLLQAVLRPPGVAHLDDPAGRDAVFQAAGAGYTTTGPAAAVDALAKVVVVRGQGVILLIGLSWLDPVVAVLLFAVWSVVRRWFVSEYFKTLEALRGGTTDLRYAGYQADVLLDPAMAKEVRVFGLGPFFLERYARMWTSGMAEVWARRGKGRRQAVALGLLVLVATAAAVVRLAWSAASGDLSAGDLAFGLQAVFASVAFASVDDTIRDVEMGLLPVRCLISVEESAADSAPASPKRAPGAAATSAGVELRGVTFAYPAAPDRVVLRDVSLSIPAGATAAIVGLNGAGKSTIVKLLAGLYEPTAGTVVLGDRQRVALVSQSFLRFASSVRDNVRFGAIGLDDEDAMRAAVAAAGASEMIDALPSGWDTVLSKEFADGADLSGGQWQRLALARALYAVAGGADVLLLDEPASSLDIRLETELHDRLAATVPHATKVLVSHRLSTVRRADVIFVVEDGCVVESGTHDELLARGGRYAGLYAVQAARYETAMEPTP